MADIFISYANEDRERAAQIAQLLELEGWHVWWDRRIPAGRSWRSVLEDAVKDTRCMVVLWSENSLKSPWVAEEAEEARRLEKALMPVSIQRVEPPLGFRAIQSANLVDWDGSRDHPAARLLVADLRSLLDPHKEKPDDRNREIEPLVDEQAKKSLLQYWPQAAVSLFAAVVLVVAMQTWRNFKPTSAVTTSPLETGAVKTAPVPRLTQLSVNADRRTIKPTETLKLQVKGQFSDGSEGDVSGAIEWSSSDARVASVDQRGEVKGIEPGTASIVAKMGGIESSAWTIGVESLKPVVKPIPEPKLVALNVSSTKQELTESERVALRARGKFSDNSEKTLSSGIEWEVSDRTVASVNERGELVARRPGKIKVVARSDDLTSSPLTFLIKETRKNLEPPPKPVKTAAPAPIKEAPALTAQAKAQIAAHTDRAQNFREQGNYAAALAELERARAIDPMNEEIKKEIEQTKRACNAERVLGNKPNC